MRLGARSTVIAAALAAAGIASPVASARPAPPGWGTTQTTVAAPAVRSNPDQQVTQVSQVGPPALKSATASQLPEVHRAQAAASRAFAYKPAASAPYSAAGLNGYGSPTKGAAAVVHVTTHSNPFDWGDAAIGAAGGLVISLLIVGGGIVATQRRQPKPGRAKALA